ATLARLVKCSQPVLRECVSLISSARKPTTSFGVVLEHAGPITVHSSQICLRRCVALLSCRTEPSRGYSEILLSAPSVEVQQAEIILGPCLSALGKRPPHFQRGLVVLAIESRQTLLEVRCDYGSRRHGGDCDPQHEGETKRTVESCYRWVSHGDNIG